MSATRSEVIDQQYGSHVAYAIAVGWPRVVQCHLKLVVARLGRSDFHRNGATGKGTDELLKTRPIALDEINDENDTNANNAHAHDERLSYFNRLNPLRESIYQPANNGVTKQSLSKNRR